MNAMAHTYDHINWKTSHRPHARLVDDLGGNSTDSRHPLSSPRQPHATDRLGTTRPNNSGPKPPGLIRWDSQGANLIDRDAHGPGRSAFTEALTAKAGVSWIRAAGPEVNRLFDEALGDTFAD